MADIPGSEAMGKHFSVLGGALAGALFCVSVADAALDNPFAWANEVNIGADIEWNVEAESISKTGQADDGLYYRLSLRGNELSLKIGESHDVEASAKRYRALAIEDLRVDGKRLPLFQWCLNNQQSHNRFIQQGLKVKDGICINRGGQGEFAIRLNKQTLDTIESGQRLRITLRPFRKPVHVTYDISDFKQVLAISQAKRRPQRAVAAASVPAATALRSSSPVVVQPVVRMCKAKVPAGYNKIKPVEYVCNDSSDRRRAEKAVAKAVKQEQRRRQRIAAEKEKQRLAALAAQKKAEEERIQAEQVRQAEEAAIAASESKHSQIMDELTRKMVAVCNKLWKRGKHRCYCEKYIEYAPPGIESDGSCANRS